MFVIVYDNQVVLGPMRWNKYRFENFLVEEHEIVATLPSTNDTETMVTVNEVCAIYPIQKSPDPVYNPVIEMLHGPFWDFSNNVATSSYQVQSFEIDAVKNTLKAKTSAERYRKEIAGTTLTIQNTTVTLTTDRDNRNNINNTYLITADNSTIQFKFLEGYLTLSKSELETIVNTIHNYVQTQFIWESNKVNEIDNCTTLEQLAAIVIEPTLSLDGPLV
jgi:hypothetical protein